MESVQAILDDIKFAMGKNLTEKEVYWVGSENGVNLTGPVKSANSLSFFGQSFVEYGKDPKVLQTFAYSNSTIETVEKGVKYVQS